jgi:hypothetical protein
VQFVHRLEVYQGTLLRTIRLKNPFRKTRIQVTCPKKVVQRLC